MLREKIAVERKLRFILQSIIKGVNMKSRQFLLPLKCCILRRDKTLKHRQKQLFSFQNEHFLFLIQHVSCNSLPQNYVGKW